MQECKILGGCLCEHKLVNMMRDKHLLLYNVSEKRYRVFSHSSIYNFNTPQFITAHYRQTKYNSQRFHYVLIILWLSCQVDLQFSVVYKDCEHPS